MNKPYVYDQMFPILDACTTLNKIKILPNYILLKFDLECKIQPSISKLEAILSLFPDNPFYLPHAYAHHNFLVMMYGGK